MGNVKAFPRTAHGRAVRHAAERTYRALVRAGTRGDGERIDREVEKYRAAMLGRGVAAEEVEQECRALDSLLGLEEDWLFREVETAYRLALSARFGRHPSNWSPVAWCTARREVDEMMGEAPGWSERLEAWLIAKGVLRIDGPEWELDAADGLVAVKTTAGFLMLPGPSVA